METITTQSPQPVAHKSVRRRTAWAVGAAVLLLGAGGGVWWQYHNRLPPADGPVEPIVRLAADARFKTLPLDQRAAYIERLEKLPMSERRSIGKRAGLDGDAARQAYKTIYDQAVRMRIHKYYSLKTKAERDAYLDKLIDEFKREQGFAKAPPVDASRVKQQLESVPANERAQAASFLQDFVSRGIMRGLGLSR